MLRILICGFIMNKETYFLDYKETVSCTKQETKPHKSPLWTIFLRNKTTHLTLNEKIRLVCYTLRKVVVKFMLVKQTGISRMHAFHVLE